jgi:hypothetical protein
MVLSNACYFMYKATSDPTYIDTVDSPMIKDLFKNCAMNNANGDFSQFSGINKDFQDKLKEFSSTVETFKAMEKTAANYTTANGNPVVGNTLKLDFEKRRDIIVDDFETYPSYSFKAARDFINGKISDTPNVAALKGGCGSVSPVSTSVDAANYLNAAPYCIEFGSNLPTADYNGARGWSASTNHDDAEDKKDEVEDHTADYQTAAADVNPEKGMNNFVTKYTTLFNAEKLYYSGPSNSLYDAFTKMQTVKGKVTDMIAYLDAFSGDLFKALDCRILGRHITSFEVALCAKFSYKLMYQTDALIALGIILFFYSWCLCCGIRCAPKRDAGKSNPSAVAPLQEAPTAAKPPQGAVMGQAQPFQPANQKYV